MSLETVVAFNPSFSFLHLTTACACAHVSFPRVHVQACIARQPAFHSLKCQPAHFLFRTAFQPLAFRLTSDVQDGLKGWKPFAYESTTSGSLTSISLVSPPGHCLNVDNVLAYELLPTDNLVFDSGFEIYTVNQTYEVPAGRVLGSWTVIPDATGAVAVEAEPTQSSQWVLATHGASCKEAQVGGVVQAVTTTPGAIYEVRVHLANRRAVVAERSRTPLADATASAFFSFGNVNALRVDVNGSAWHDITFRTKAFASSSTLVLKASGSNCMWFDNVRVTEIEPAPENIVTNGGFEAPQLAGLNGTSLDTMTVQQNTTMGGWTQGLGPGLLLGLDQPSVEGVQAWALKATCGTNDRASGSITQNVATDVDQYYKISFWARGHATEQPYFDVVIVSFGSVQVRIAQRVWEENDAKIRETNKKRGKNSLNQRKRGIKPIQRQL